MPSVFQHRRGAYSTQTAEKRAYGSDAAYRTNSIKYFDPEKDLRDQPSLQTHRETHEKENRDFPDAVVEDATTHQKSASPSGDTSGLVKESTVSDMIIAITGTVISRTGQNRVHERF